MTIIYNGLIYLKKGSFCEALAIEGGRIVRTGSSRELLESVPAGIEKIDAEDALILPAFHDNHLHLMSVGRRAGEIEAAGACSIDDVIRRAREHIARHKPPAGTYIQGFGVNPDLFTSGEKRDLRREDVDTISTEYPVILGRHCWHTIYCNSAALRLAGFGESAPDIAGGIIEKDENGRPTGVCRESANALIRKPIPAHSRETMQSFLKLAMRTAHSLGIASCGSYDTGGPDLEKVIDVYRGIYEEFRQEGRPGLRVTMQCGISTQEDLLDAFLSRKAASPAPLWEDSRWGTLLTLGPLKLFIDGTLGGHTAWMRQPYHDKPETRGFPVLELDAFNRFVQKAAAAGVQVIVHAIGDAGIDAALTAFEATIAPQGNNPLRHGILHCQITSPDLLERMAQNRILAMAQPIFLEDDRHVLESRVGPLMASTSYAWGSMNRLGVPVSYGTDAPVSPLNPLLGIAWSVSRCDSEDPAGTVYSPGERVDVSAAVDAYTSAPAFSGFAEHSRGRIAPGYLADLVFLDRDIFSVPPRDIPKAQVLRTMCAGETVYSA